MKNIEFIPASNLPTTEAEEVDVLCVENGELKRKAGASLGGGGGSMEVDIVLSGNDFYSGTVTFSHTYDEIKTAMDKGCFVIGWVRNQEFTGERYQYHAYYLRATFPKYAPDINGGTIFFISPDRDISSFHYIQADGTTGSYSD